MSQWRLLRVFASLGHAENIYPMSLDPQTPFIDSRSPGNTSREKKTPLMRKNTIFT